MTQRVHSTLALHCCTHCAQQVPDRDSDPGIDLTFETARRCLRVCTPAGGCSSAGRSLPPSSTFRGAAGDDIRQQMLFCPREEMTESRVTVEEMLSETPTAAEGSAARRRTQYTYTQTCLTHVKGFTTLTGKHTPRANGIDSSSGTSMNHVEEISAHPKSRGAKTTAQIERSSISCKVDGFLLTANNRSCSAKQKGRTGSKDMGRDPAADQIERETMNKRSPGSPSTDEGFAHVAGNSGTSIPLLAHIVYTPLLIVSKPRANEEDPGKNPRRYFVEKLSGFLLSYFAGGAADSSRSNACCEIECLYPVITNPKIEVRLARYNFVKLGQLHTDSQREHVSRTDMSLGTPRKVIGSPPTSSISVQSVHTVYVSSMVNFGSSPPRREGLNRKCTRLKTNESNTKLMGRRLPSDQVTTGGSHKDNAAILLVLTNKNRNKKIKYSKLKSVHSASQERTQMEVSTPAKAFEQNKYHANMNSKSEQYQLNSNIEKEKKETCRREAPTPADTKRSVTPDTLMIPTTTPTKTNGSKVMGLWPTATVRNEVSPPPLCSHLMHAVAYHHTTHMLEIQGFSHETHQPFGAGGTHRGIKDARAHPATPLARKWAGAAVPKSTAPHAHKNLTQTNQQWMLPSAHPQIFTPQISNGGAATNASADATKKGKPSPNTMTAGAPPLNIMNKKVDPPQRCTQSPPQCDPHKSHTNRGVAPTGEENKGGLLSHPSLHTHAVPRDSGILTRWCHQQKKMEELYLSSAEMNPSRIARIYPGADRAGELARMVAMAEVRKKAEGMLPPGQGKAPPRQGGGVSPTSRIPTPGRRG